MPLVGRYQVAAFARGAVAIHSTEYVVSYYIFHKGSSMSDLKVLSFGYGVQYTHGSLCLCSRFGQKGFQGQI